MLGPRINAGGRIGSADLGVRLLLEDDPAEAARLAGEKKPVSTLFYLPPPPGASFLQALTVRIEEFLAKGRAPYPVERTLLTTGIHDSMMRSRQTPGDH